MAIIETLDGKVIDLVDCDIQTLGIDIQSPTPVQEFTTIQGVNGAYHNGTTFGPREIRGRFIALARTRDTFSLLRDEVFALFGSKKAFFLSQKKTRGKRWLVVVNNPFEIPQTHYFGQFEVTFLAIKGVAESKLSTQTIQRNGVPYDGNWSYGMGLRFIDDSELIYTHRTKNFMIFNAGNVEVHPFESMLKIEIRDVAGSSDKVSLVNKTNGSRIDINKKIAAGEVWKIDGAVIQRNSLNATRDTSKKFISLDPGENNFELVGATSATISFDFNYLYL